MKLKTKVGNEKKKNFESVLMIVIESINQNI